MSRTAWYDSPSRYVGFGAVLHHGDSTGRPRYGVTIRSTPASYIPFQSCHHAGVQPYRKSSSTADARTRILGSFTAGQSRHRDGALWRASALTRLHAIAGAGATTARESSSGDFGITGGLARSVHGTAHQPAAPRRRAWLLERARPVASRRPGRRSLRLRRAGLGRASSLRPGRGSLRGRRRWGWAARDPELRRV